MKAFFISLGLLCLSINLQAQLQKIIHQTFSVDEFNAIEFDLYGTFELESWAGNEILTETQIKLYRANSAILEHFVDAGRYKILEEVNGETIRLSSQDKERKPIRVREGEESSEEVVLRIYIPDTFAESEPLKWSRTGDTMKLGKKE